MKNLLWTIPLLAGVGAIAQTTATVSANLSDIATNSQSANVTMRLHASDAGDFYRRRQVKGSKHLFVHVPGMMCLGGYCRKVGNSWVLYK